jgi:hypothetical protein
MVSPEERFLALLFSVLLGYLAILAAPLLVTASVHLPARQGMSAR